MSKDIIEIINDNVTFLQYYEKQRKEIERLKEVEKEHQKLNGELREEVERLNKENEELKKIQCTFLGTGCKAEIERLNNIINKLEEYIHNELVLDFYNDNMPCELIINKMENMIKKLKAGDEAEQYLQELKGSDK